MLFRSPGLYAVAFGLPITELFPEAIATGEALAYLEADRDAAGRSDVQDDAPDPDEPRLAEARRILYPAYGTYVGGAAGQFVGLSVGLPIYAGAVVAGHATGRAANHADRDPPAESSHDDETAESTDSPPASLIGR